MHNPFASPADVDEPPGGGDQVNAHGVRTDDRGGPLRMAALSYCLASGLGAIALLWIYGHLTSLERFCQALDVWSQWDLDTWRLSSAFPIYGFLTIGVVVKAEVTGSRSWLIGLPLILFPQVLWVSATLAETVPVLFQDGFAVQQHGAFLVFAAGVLVVAVVDWVYYLCCTRRTRRLLAQGVPPHPSPLAMESAEPSERVVDPHHRSARAFAVGTAFCAFLVGLLAVAELMGLLGSSLNQWFDGDAHFCRSLNSYLLRAVFFACIAVFWCVASRQFWLSRFRHAVMYLSSGVLVLVLMQFLLA